MKLYAEISKTEELDDGTVKVWGYASSSAVDSDGETITADAMKAALPDYMKFGAVREMHQAKAAGTAIEASVEEDGRTYFGAHVVDSEAVRKVKSNVYKGFSIGGKVTERDNLNKSIIKGIKLVEVSLVDRPANPEALFTMYKAEDIELSAVDQLAAMLDKGEISPERLIELAKADKVEPEKESEPDAPVELEKKGAAFSSSTKDKLKKAHEAIKTASDHMDSLGYANDDDDSQKADAVDSLAKMADMSNELSKLQGENAELAKRVAELEAQPEPAKGVLKVVEKGQDIAPADIVDEAEITKGMTPEELAMHEIRKVYATGGRPLSQR